MEIIGIVILGPLAGFMLGWSIRGEVARREWAEYFKTNRDRWR